MVKVILGEMVVTSVPLGTKLSTVQGAEPETTLQVEQSSNIYYQVRSGDTLWNVSRKFNTSVDFIIRANNLTSDVLQLNQRLIIPKTFHTVATGDYLTVLAKKYGTTVDAIKEVNNLTSDATRLGQTLIIPILIDGTAITKTAPTTTQTPTQTQTQTQTTSYTVVSGDSLSVIAKRYGTSVEVLRSTNNLSSDFLRVGQVLSIPSGGESDTETAPVTTEATGTYTVVSGDRLSVIAKRFGVTVEALRSANNLSSDFLRVGQV
ncbi:MAG: LysM peptidoglycan-binding domain-containing protein [Bacillota bacterium]